MSLEFCIDDLGDLIASIANGKARDLMGSALSVLVGEKTVHACQFVGKTEV